jgi:hypothetical protein
MFRNIGQKFVNYTPLEQANEVAENAEPAVEQNIPIPELENTIQPQAQNSSARAETQLAGMSMQMSLNKNLERQLSKPELSLQKDESVPLKEMWELFKPLPTEINTGAGDDKVEINKEADNLVHVKVNGKEIWSGSEIQFQRLKIDTGDGDDQVINKVDGANIFTGAGNDTVENTANDVRIDTGNESDTVISKGSRNRIETGRGSDKVKNYGTSNEIRTGREQDRVDSDGDLNTIESGDGDDTVRSWGDENTILGGRGNDDIIIAGDDNVIFGNENDDNVELRGDRNFADVGDGEDKAAADTYYGNDNEIVDPDRIPE